MTPTFNRAQSVSLMRLATALSTNVKLTVTDVDMNGNIGIKAHSDDAFHIEALYRLPPTGGYTQVYDRTPPVPTQSSKEDVDAEV